NGNNSNPVKSRILSSVTYIPLAELSQELDILRKVAKLERKENDVTMMDTNVSIVHTVQAMNVKQNEDVPIGIVTINGERTDAPIDPGSSGKGRIVDDSISNFLGYISNIEVNAKGVKVMQEFYVIESASFDMLLGMS
ncbi:9180_t:CDS:2, partial [Scutellospora calospora]